MANTTFTNQSTVIKADWLNDVNDVVYDVLGDGVSVPATADEVRQNIGAPKIDGTNATGTWGISITGNAATATTASSVTNGLYTTDLGVSVQAYDATTAKTGATQSFTAPQRGTVTTDNDLSFDLSVTNNFTCTPTAGGALTFTNIAAGQSGFIKLVNGADYAITAAANTKVTSTFLATISVTGTYIISYYSDGTDVYCATAGAMA